MLVCDQQATINRRAAAWRKGIGCTFCRAKPSPYKIEGEGGRFCSTKRKTSSCLCGLHDVARPGEPDKKIGQRSGTPRGRRHATTSANLLIPLRKGGIERARVRGRVHLKFEDFEGGGSWRMVCVWAGKAASYMELGAFPFFWSHD